MATLNEVVLLPPPSQALGWLVVADWGPKNFEQTQYER
jgi:hypothetical protein